MAKSITLLQTERFFSGGSDETEFYDILIADTLQWVWKSEYQSSPTMKIITSEPLHLNDRPILHLCIYIAPCAAGSCSDMQLLTIV